MDQEKINTIELVWKRNEESIQGMYYPSFVTKGESWCYTVYPLVRPKQAEPTGFHFAGWSNPNGQIVRMRMEGQATTSEECKAMCEAHRLHIYNSKISE